MDTVCIEPVKISEDDSRSNESEISRFQNASLDSSSFRNCTGFVKYMLGFSDQETFVSPRDLTEKGLLCHLDPIGQLEIPSSPGTIVDTEFQAKASQSDALGILVNYKEEDVSFEARVNKTGEGWRYVHFGYIDPKDFSKIYMRSDIEKKPSHVNWREFVKCAEEFPGEEKMLVFFRKK